MIHSTLKENLLEELADFDKQKEVVCGLCVGFIVMGLPANGSRFEYPMESKKQVDHSGKLHIDQSEKQSEIDTEKDSENLPKFSSFGKDFPFDNLLEPESFKSFGKEIQPFSDCDEDVMDTPDSIRALFVDPETAPSKHLRS